MDKLKHKFRSYDKFTAGRPQLKVDFEGTGPAYKSYMGAAVSILYIIMVTTFLWSKVTILVNSSQTVVTTNLIEGAVDQADIFSNEDGLFVAAGLTEFDNNQAIVEDPSYGQIVFQHISWDITNTDKVEVSRNELETHACSDAELGLLEDQGNLYYAVNKQSAAVVKLWK